MLSRKNIILTTLLTILMAANVWAAFPSSSSSPATDFLSNEHEFADVEDAFIFNFSQQGDQLELRWDILDEYYLYKKQFKFVIKDGQIGEVSFPEAIEQEDEFFGLSEVYREKVTLTIPIEFAPQDAVLKIRYQGCADAGLCYPPTTKQVFLDAVAGSGNIDYDSLRANSQQQTPISEQQQLSDLLFSNDNLAIVLLTFFILGIGLAFTPCVFPMYPILSGIIAGQGEHTNFKHCFVLSFIYVQGMAITYTLLGLVVASAGMQYQAALQAPAVLITLSVLFVVLSLSMFGLYELTLPNALQNKLNNLSKEQKGGTFTGVLIMGMISGLVASPCTTAPLSGVLLYVAQSGDLLLGGSTLYALSIGMGLPLILLGTSGGKLLPKAGNWMNVIKVLFGVMLLAVAIVLMERIVDSFWTNLAWSLLILASGSYLLTMNQDTKTSFWKGLRSLIIFLGLFAGAIVGYHTLFPQTSSTQQHEEVPFIAVKDLNDLTDKVRQANAKGQFAMVDLYADWCVACKQFEKYTFPTPKVRQALSGFTLLRLDATENTLENTQILQHYDVLGLPTLLFFDSQGREMKQARVTGFMNENEFSQHVNQITASLRSN